MNFDFLWNGTVVAKYVVTSSLYNVYTTIVMKMGSDMSSPVIYACSPKYPEPYLLAPVSLQPYPVERPTRA